MSRRLRSAEFGFSLLEALIAMALMGLVLAGLSTITAQWLPNWNRGFVSVQSQDLLQRGLERVLADLSAAEYVPFKGGDLNPLFAGTENSVTFIRPALGPNASPGLEIVRIEENLDQHDLILVRTRVRFTPGAPDADSLPPLGDPVVVIRSPYRVTFSYAGDDRVWKATWQNAAQLPRTIRLLLRNTATGRRQPVSTVARIHVDTPPPRTQDGTSTKATQTAKDLRQ